jgi:Lipid A 3-O-deacylase (PagL)/OmpA-like transmembrane domain
VLFFVSCSVAFSQDSRTQYPRILSHSYFGLDVGYINYPFRDTRMESGFGVQDIRVPHLAVQALLFGHKFSPHVSAQVSYMRPVQWVQYQNVNGDLAAHSVWMNIAGVTAKARLPVTGSLSVYGEAGLGLITRKGFAINSAPAVKDANYATMLLGGGLQYRIGEKWDLVAGSSWSPAHSQMQQPSTTFYSAGFRYSIHPLSAEQVEANSNTGWIFPKQILQAGYTTNALGYGANDFVSRGAVPIFWAADAQVASGFSLNYNRNVFHTRRTFSLDWGGGASIWKASGEGAIFVTASLYPVFRFTAIRTSPFDLYFNYSIAGPTFISRTIIDGEETGRRFTFQDFMGLGSFIGRKRSTNVEIRISHFSNGNLFPRNAGVTVPITVIVGRSF